MLTPMATETPTHPLAATEPAIAPETIRLQPSKGFSRVLSPPELWRYRDLALQIAMRDITIRYRQTALGGAWAILQPIGFMVVFSLIFGNVAGISSNGLPYPLFSLGALVPWVFFANSMLLGSESLVSNAALVSKIYFPRIFIPAGPIVAGFVDLAISTVILLAIAVIWGYPPGVAILTLPLLIAIAAAAALGVGSALSAINVRFRDVKYVVPFAIQLWLFITPIVYANSSIDQPWRTISAINPMVGVVEGFRWATLGTGDAPWTLIGISAASAVVLFVAGLAYFDRVERSFADFV
jgi:lipopolysaccharide transport system permease protein